MTWKSFHNRGEILRSVIATADVRRDGKLPMDVDGVRETFGDELSLLGALQLRWHTRLAGRIERELLGQPMDLEAAVLAAWRGTAAEMPGVLNVLDHYKAEPVDEAMAEALAKATAKEHTLLAVMAGQSSTRGPGRGPGRRRAREQGPRHAAPGAPDPPCCRPAGPVRPAQGGPRGLSATPLTTPGADAPPSPRFLPPRHPSRVGSGVVLCPDACDRPRSWVMMEA